jgi:NADH:ubiquinone oxidoreductase subunit K
MPKASPRDWEFAFIFVALAANETTNAVFLLYFLCRAHNEIVISDIEMLHEWL